MQVTIMLLPVAHHPNTALEPSSYLVCSLLSSPFWFSHITLQMLMCAHVHLCARASGSQKTTLDVIPQVSSAFFFFRPCLSLAWNFPGKLGWLTIKLQGSPCLCLPRDGIATACYHAELFFLWILGTRLRSLAARQTLSPLIHLPAPYMLVS